MAMKTQLDKFKEAARALGALIISEKDFNAALKDVGTVSQSCGRKGPNLKSDCPT
jgi:hypothetical protein